MKKLFLCIILLPLLAISCNDEFPEGTDGKGSLKLNVTVDAEYLSQSVTRDSTDPADYYVSVAGPENRTLKMPADRIIRNLPAGTYTVTVTSYENGLPAPAFENPIFGATASAIVLSKKQTTLPVECKPHNAALRVTYDDEVEGMDIAVSAAQGAHTPLVYTGDRRDATGYFNPGQVEITAMVDGVAMKINGKDKYELEVDGAQAWILHIESVDAMGGSLNVVVELEDIEIDEKEVVISEMDPIVLNSFAEYGSNYFGPNDSPSHFITMLDAPRDYSEGNGVWTLFLQGYSTAQEPFGFSLAPGRYVIKEGFTMSSETGEEMTLMQGYYDEDFGYMYGTFFTYFDYDNEPWADYTKYYLAHEGEFTVDYIDNVMHLKGWFLEGEEINVTFDEEVNPIYESVGTFGTMAFEYTNEAGRNPLWFNMWTLPVVPLEPGSVDISTIPQKKYTATGTEAFAFVGMDSWEGAVYVDEENNTVTLTNWGGYTNNEDGMPEFPQLDDRFPLTLNLVDGNLLVDTEQEWIVEQWDTQFVCHWRGTYSPYSYITEPEQWLKLDWDPAGRKFTFTQKMREVVSSEEEQIYDVALGVIGSTWASVGLTEFYTNITITLTDEDSPARTATRTNSTHYGTWKMKEESRRLPADVRCRMLR